MMTGVQVGSVTTAFVILALITAAAQFGWLPAGTPRTVLVFVAGAGIVVALRVAGIPPRWFAGTKAGFGFSTSLILSGLISGGADARAFGLPLLLGMGLTLLGLNIVAFVKVHI